MGRFNPERAATILVEAAYYGDKTAADRNAVTERSIRNYRARLDEDSELSAFFLIKKQRFEEAWADELPGAIRASIDYLGRAAKTVSTTDPNAIHSIAGALKILADVAMTKQVLDARLTGRGESETEEIRAMASD